jgi:putative glutathione S-transferase
VLWAYARDLFQTPGFGDTIDFHQIKQHYYGCIAHQPHRHRAPRAGWMPPHHRDELRPPIRRRHSPSPPHHERVDTDNERSAA